MDQKNKRPLPNSDNEDSDHSEQCPLSDEGELDIDAKDFTKKQEIMMVEFFSNCPMFWDKSDPDHSHTHVKGKEMAKLASKLGKTTMEITKWFQSQRRCYSRNRKLQEDRLSGAAKSRKPTTRMLWNLRH